jgi:hypothetical protein
LIVELNATPRKALALQLRRQGSVGAALSRGGAGTATTPIRGVLLTVTAASTEEQMEEGMHGVPTGGVAWPIIVATLQVETVEPGVVKLRPGTTVMPQVEAAQMGPSPVRTEMATPATEAV